MTIKICFLVAILAVVLTSGQDIIGCFIDGDCQDSRLAAETQTSSPSKCLAFCQSNSQCNYLTHYEDLGACLAWIDCQTFSQDCQDCVSGDQDCPDLECSVQGSCIGTLVDLIAPVTDAGNCLSVCQSNPNCQWFSFDTSDNFCFLMSDCDEIDESCASCTSGQRNCEDEAVEPDSRKTLFLDFILF